jgi:hypothetical protein
MASGTKSEMVRTHAVLPKGSSSRSTSENVRDSPPNNLQVGWRV